MIIKIYINNRPMEEYSEDEMKEIRIKLTENAFKAAGFVREKPDPAEAW